MADNEQHSYTNFLLFCIWVVLFSILMMLFAINDKLPG